MVECAQCILRLMETLTQTLTPLRTAVQNACKSHSLIVGSKTISNVDGGSVSVVVEVVTV